ncbi:CHASE domain-containing protein [Marinomonas sp. A79]|uniref:CHASE domain-containing protein n=1 Tax=Marinomonas vulgaris TaxID=2823372 RepID=A0ABS5H7V2_9GAMM|nr:CHASE domain-containing protein [Marinomonas vulgaris]MBR7887786.1 CHASE domain-containing protein [Marinomonas vulgaris]
MNNKRLEQFGGWLWLVVLLLGSLITLCVALFAYFQDEHKVQVYSSTLADRTETLIEERFQQFEYGLRATRGAIVAAGVDDITRQQFERYSNSRDIEGAFPGALGFGFIRRVPVDQEASFVARIRKDGVPDFTVRALAEHDQDRFIIQYIYPFVKNSQALGLDVGSEANRRLAAMSAAREDKTYLTQPITLVQANKKARKGALILYPIYTDGKVLNTSEEREDALVGWAYAPLVIDDVLANLGELTDQAAISLTNTKEGEPFYRAHDRELLALDDEKKVVRSIFILGQQWELELIPTLQSTERIRFWDVGWVVAIGLLLTLFAMLAVNLLRTSRSIKEQEIDIHQVGIKSVMTFFTSTRFNRSWPYTVLILLVVLFIATWLILQSNLKRVSNELSVIKETTIENISQEAAQYRRDTLFLANTSPILRIETQVDKSMQSINRDQVYNEWSEGNYD